jgi:mRNA-degrading endonuclease toxin of MazEF toxin-antitoxin module
MAKRGDDFTRGYTPQQGDIVHLNWQPSVGSEMKGPHYGLVVSQSTFNIGTGLVMVCPITSKTDKLSGFDLPIRSGRVSGAAVLSQMRTLDYMNRAIEFESKAPADDVLEASRRIKMIF